LYTFITRFELFRKLNVRISITYDFQLQTWLQSGHDYSKSIVDYKVLASCLVIGPDYSGTADIVSP